MSTALIDHIRAYVRLDDNHVAAIRDYMQPISLRKKEFLLKEGQLCKGDYFVEKGCLRMFFVNEKGLEQITYFAIENWWLSDYMSLIRDLPAAHNIQAIEDSRVLMLSKVDQDKLLEEVPVLERYFRIMQQRANAAAQMRIKQLYEMSKEEHYLRFLERYPEFVQRVPQYMLASFLGLTPEYLSEIRKKLSQ